MVRIVQAVGKEIYYNYLRKLGFGEKTWIELAGEEEWFVGHSTTVSLARFLNNSFWLGMRATPIQIATAYATLLNGWYLVKPTIIAKIYDQELKEEKVNPVNIVRRVFKENTALELQDALYDVIHLNKDNKKNTAVEWFAVGWKSWTSEITYKGKYIGSAGWTNGSFVWIVTQKNPKYVIVVQVRRPRTSKWWGETAGRIFQAVAEFIIWYELIPE
jgi:cell division protein FtsI/penicillin-binding protein 2